MSHEAILETIKTELETADAATLQSIWETLRQAKQGSIELSTAVGGQLSRRSSTTTASEKPVEFVGENSPFDPNRKFSFEEKAAAKRRLKAQNREWLLQKFNELRAGWLMVVDGQVIASGATLSDYPTPEQLLAVCHRTGKFPFLFINEKIMMIEESGSVWHLTNIPRDFYPTVPVKIRSDKATAAIVGDLDTGAIPTFVDYDFLIGQNLIQPQTPEETDDAQHLGQAYEHLTRNIVIEIFFPSGEVRSLEVPIACVTGWQNSPFVAINPNRTALLGRAIFLMLKPRILLDFDKQESKLWAPLQRRKKKKQS
jgi:hypothetical protein